MRWFCKPEKQSFCRKCEHAFKPRINDDFSDYCAACAAPMKDRKRRQSLVMDWACSNWEKLEPHALAYFEAQRGVFNAMSQASMSQQAHDVLAG